MMCLSKLLKVGTEDKEDRISSLPDAIICHILSFLPTKYSVATCILSSRWKLLWTSLPSLCFDDRLCSEYERNGALSEGASTRFENFVYWVLLLCNSGKISKFSLHCSKLRDVSRLKLWVSFAIMRKAREIELNLENHASIELPMSIYTSEATEVLKLNLNFFIKTPPSGICFPSVKILYVTIHNLDENLIKRLFSNCPALEVLKIKGYLSGDRLVTFNISSPTLKRLDLAFKADDGDEFTDHQVVIKTPNLEYLYIREDYPIVSYVVHELHPLTKVFVHFSFEFVVYRLNYGFGDPSDSAHTVVQFFKEISNVKFLSLSKDTVTILEYGDPYSILEFPNVTHLEMVCGETDLGEGLVFPFTILSSTPNLESFIFEKDIGTDFGWYKPECVPSCLLSHVKRIEIRGFQGQKDLFELIKFLLKNGEVLNRMIIRFQQTLSQKMHLKEKLYQKLLTFPRGSKTCQVKVL